MYYIQKYYSLEEDCNLKILRLLLLKRNTICSLYSKRMWKICNNKKNLIHITESKYESII